MRAGFTKSAEMLVIPLQNTSSGSQRGRFYLVDDIQLAVGEDRQCDAGDDDDSQQCAEHDTCPLPSLATM